jgi:aryl-alcohol dehydrogenase (NADP+)
MTFGLQCDEATSVAVLDRAASGGITFLDTADVYLLGSGLDTVGRTEEIVGRCIQGAVHDIMGATKGFGCHQRPGLGPREPARASPRRHGRLAARRGSRAQLDDLTRE